MSHMERLPDTVTGIARTGMDGARASISYYSKSALSMSITLFA